MSSFRLVPPVLTLPASQSTQAVCAVFECLPAGHSVHAELPVLAAIKPGSQALQPVEPAVENVPRAQELHVPADFGLKEPAPQSRHFVLSSVYCPCGQGWQAPPEYEMVPVGHCWQPV